MGWLIFNRPAALNALSRTMMAELPEAWAELDSDPEVRVIVNTGVGRGFQTGIDLKETASIGMPQDVQGTSPRFTARANNVWKPVICAVNGVCAGLGLLFVVDADLTITSSDAAFLDPHVSVGQVSALEPIGLLDSVPLGSIMRMVFMGRQERVDAFSGERDWFVDPDRGSATITQKCHTNHGGENGTQLPVNNDGEQARNLAGNRRSASTRISKRSRDHPRILESP